MAPRSPPVVDDLTNSMEALQKAISSSNRPRTLPAVSQGHVQQPAIPPSETESASAAPSLLAYPATMHNTSGSG
eukprot:1984631-Amphidinium_carterae.1